MSFGDLLIVVLRWAHGLAAIVWLGGGLYSTLVLGPHLQALGDAVAVSRLRTAVGREFARLVDLSTVVFIVSGVVLTFDRLSSQGATVTYGIVLAVKVALALWMFGIAQGLKRRRRSAQGQGQGAIRQTLGSPRLLLWLGALVVLLAAVLQVLYEATLRR